ncbi:Cna protein B-type domain protein [compost metagenome]
MLSAVAAAMVAILAFTGLATQPLVAQAATVSYEFTGSWDSPPATVTSGSDVLSAVWRFDINDNSAAPSNDPVPNNVVKFAASNSTFTEIPTVCLTTGVTPVSNLSVDKKTLTCNIGTRDQGTAQVSFTGLVPNGNSGDQVGLTGTFLDKTVDLPNIPIANKFVMDAKFDGGSNTVQSGNDQILSFGWSVSHSSGSLPGPDTVSYDLTVSGSNGEVLSLDGTGCSAIDSRYAGFPYSDATHNASNTAKFPTCTLTRVSAGKYTLKLSNLSYTGPFPTVDSNGNNLPTGMDVIASGKVAFKFTYVSSGTFKLSASTPTYIASSNTNITSIDTSANNSNAQAYQRGIWTHGFIAVGALSQGSTWTDTYRTFADSSVMSNTGVAGAVGNAMCVVLDTKYVTFESAKVASASNVAAYTGAAIWYYIGTHSLVTPSNANYDPNAWTGCEATPSTATGWTTTLPSDLSTVKAVSVTQTQALINQGLSSAGILGLYVSQKIKATTPVGMDVWSWGSYKFNGTWNRPNRETAASNVPASGTVTPKSRYPYAAGGRDVLRVIAAVPRVEKEVTQKEAGPGSEVDYTLRYGLTGAAGSNATGEVVLVDKLPAGLEYMAGSSVPATPAPVITGTVATGQTITWTISGVAVNKSPLDALTFKALVPETAAPGSTYTNTVTSMSSNQSATASAAFAVPKAGYTTLKKKATTAVAPTTNGSATDGWTVSMTSVDPVTAAKTDTIDILPYIGDGRGTAFSGNYKLSQAVTAVSGATVYYTTADPTSLKEDPKDVSNGGFATIAGNTVNWTTTYTPNATAVRVIGPALAFGKTQDFTVQVVTAGSKANDVFVNTAVGRSTDTALRMRTSDKFTIKAMPATTIKKYVQDSSGDWHDAQTAADYPAYDLGDAAKYRLVVENTGNMDLVNLPLTDTKANLGQLLQDSKLTSSTPLTGNANDGASITELAAGQKATIEYDLVIIAEAVKDNMLVNSACVTAGTGNSPGFDEVCDPAGVKVYSSLAWVKISAYSDTTFLSGSEWNLVPVPNDGGTPAAEAAVIPVVDCIEATATACTGRDVDPHAGQFKVKSLESGWYRLVETKAPNGYKLDTTPHYIQVSGTSAFAEGIVNELVDVPTIPLTGGVGSLGFWLGGGLGGLLVTAGLFWQRRRNISSVA